MKHVPSSYWVKETQVEIWEFNEKCCGNTSRQASVSRAFSSSPKYSWVFSITWSIETQYTIVHVFYFFWRILNKHTHTHTQTIWMFIWSSKCKIIPFACTIIMLTACATKRSFMLPLQITQTSVLIIHDIMLNLIQ